MEINFDEIICQLARLHVRRMELANILSEWIRNPGKGSLGSSNPKNVLPVHFRGLVWKRVWKITFFGLQQGQDLENRAAHPHQEFPGSIPRALFLSYIGWGVPPLPPTRARPIFKAFLCYLSPLHCPTNRRFQATYTVFHALESG